MEIPVTTSVPDKEGLPGTSAKICAWQSGQTFKNVGNVQHVWNVGNAPDVSDVLNVHFIYICRYLADKQLLSLTVNTFIH